MPITLLARCLPPLLAALDEIGRLHPAPTPKARYVLAKAAPLAQAAYTAHSAALKAFLDGAVTTGADGAPVYQELPGGALTFTLRPEHVAAYAELQETRMTLDGVRVLTHAELGDCPLTVAHEAALLAGGLLEDAEPA